MPLPLKPGYHFHYEHNIRPPYFEMTAAEAYTDFYAVSYIISGELLSCSPSVTKIIRAGDLTFTPKNIYFRTVCVSDEPRENFLMKFTDSMIDDFLRTAGFDSFNEFYAAHATIHIQKSAQDKVLSIIRELEKEWNAYGRYSEILLKGLLNKLIITAIRDGISDPYIPTIKSKSHEYYMDAAVQYIHMHLTENPTLSKTAAAVNISASYLSKLFINYMHTPFSTFVLNEKVLAARNLLADSRLSINEIAFKTGFSSSAYFSDCFKRITGESPLQFRKKYERFENG
ncbi:MAG: AraC family transcriptional regulator [Lachnospiraceae bacterium]|nr:AraC family transcriptional regulator [Lachnospiraceae bacterium]